MAALTYFDHLYVLTLRLRSHICLVHPNALCNDSRNPNCFCHLPIPKLSTSSLTFALSLFIVKKQTSILNVHLIDDIWVFSFLSEEKANLLRKITSEIEDMDLQLRYMIKLNYVSQEIIIILI